jgi:hypothetical protein
VTSLKSRLDSDFGSMYFYGDKVSKNLLKEYINNPSSDILKTKEFDYAQIIFIRSIIVDGIHNLSESDKKILYEYTKRDNFIKVFEEVLTE